MKKKVPGVENLDSFAVKEPTWETLPEMAQAISKNNIADEEFSSFREASPAHRDQQHENATLAVTIFLVVQRIIACIELWRHRSCRDLFYAMGFGYGQHKYASELRRYLENVHFVYPPGLR